MKTRLTYFILGMVLAGMVFGQSEKSNAREPEVTIRRTLIHKIKSSSNDVLYPIYVALPASYANSNKSYPVIIQLDAYSSFGTLVQMQRLLLFNKEVPDVIVVGVSSEGGSKEFNYNRARDFTPTYVAPDSLPQSMRGMLPVSGGADKFLSFIKNELIPFIEEKYRIDKEDLTLAGHSLGGLFCFYALFSEPELFRRYIILSPALGWDKEFIFSIEENFYKEQKNLNAVIYTAAGGLESESFIEPWKKMIGLLKSRSISGLIIKDEFLPDETHYSIIPFMATHGLKSVFNN